jgi:hypothetical protein
MFGGSSLIALERAPAEGRPAPPQSFDSDVMEDMRILSLRGAALDAPKN